MTYRIGRAEVEAQVRRLARNLNIELEFTHGSSTNGYGARLAVKGTGTTIINAEALGRTSRQTYTALYAANQMLEFQQSRGVVESPGARAASARHARRASQ